MNISEMDTHKQPKARHSRSTHNASFDWPDEEGTPRPSQVNYERLVLDEAKSGVPVVFIHGTRHDRLVSPYCETLTVDAGRQALTQALDLG